MDSRHDSRTIQNYSIVSLPFPMSTNTASADRSKCQTFLPRWSIAAICLLGVFSLSPTLAMDRIPQTAKPIVGWLEQIRISPPGLLLEGKLDTGADVSSLHATDIQEYAKEGQSWVRFMVKDRKGDQAIMHEPLVRIITITRHGGREEKRPVVMLHLCLGHIAKTVEVSLVDRTGLKFPFLIGRNFMAGSLLLDPLLEFTSKPSCESPPVL